MIICKRTCEAFWRKFRCKSKAITFIQKKLAKNPKCVRIETMKQSNGQPLKKEPNKKVSCAIIRDKLRFIMFQPGKLRRSLNNAYVKMVANIAMSDTIKDPIVTHPGNVTIKLNLSFKIVRLFWDTSKLISVLFDRFFDMNSSQTLIKVIES